MLRRLRRAIAALTPNAITPTAPGSGTITLAACSTPPPLTL
jgi:hypothetical protein